jgi:hypothetical protein
VLESPSSLNLNLAIRKPTVLTAGRFKNSYRFLALIIQGMEMKENSQMAREEVQAAVSQAVLI